MSKVNVFGINIDNVTMQEAVNICLKYTKGKSLSLIFTPNPEFVMKAQNDMDFKKVLNYGDLLIPDGIGLVIASKIMRNPLQERVTGCDLVENLFKLSIKEGLTFFFLGSKPDIIELAKKNVEKKYDGIKILGTHHGYFNQANEKEVINKINSVSPDILLVGLGFPKQEKWIFANKEILNAKVAICIGGAFDIFSGTTKRAPQLFKNLGLEWFYRLTIRG